MLWMGPWDILIKGALNVIPLVLQAIWRDQVVSLYLVVGAIEFFLE